MQQFQAIYAQFLNDPADDILIDRTVVAVSECQPVNAIIVTSIHKQVLSKNSSAIISSILSHDLLDEFKEHAQSWIQMLLNFLNKETSNSSLATLIRLLATCHSQKITFNHMCVGKTYTLLIRLLKRGITGKLVDGLKSMLISFPHAAKSHGKDLEELLDCELSSVTSHRLVVSLTETLVSLSCLDGKNVHNRNTQAFIDKLCNTLHFLLTELTGGTHEVDVEQHHQEMNDRFPLSLPSDIHSRLSSIMKLIIKYSSCLVTLIS